MAGRKQENERGRDQDNDGTRQQKQREQRDTREEREDNRER